MAIIYFSFLIVSGLIAFWRGVWGFLDMYLIPGHLSLSYVLSFLLGVVIIGITHYTLDRLV